MSGGNTRAMGFRENQRSIGKPNQTSGSPVISEKDSKLT
jgi:hypothetical protein